MANSKKKYYAVAIGRTPGIYDQWFGADGAEAQIKNFPAARYKGFPSRSEAEEWMEGIKSGKISATYKGPVTQGTSSTENGSNTTVNGNGEILPPADIGNGTVVMYTDGGCRKNPGIGGYGAVILNDGDKTEISAGFKRTTNNRMELLACIEGLKRFKESADIVLFTDSQYVVNGIQKGWAQKWRRNNWMRTPDSPAENYDMWEILLELTEKHRVEFRWVKGHAGNPGNERCDRLANIAMDKPQSLLIDENFENGATTIKKAGRY